MGEKCVFIFPSFVNQMQQVSFSHLCSSSLIKTRSKRTEEKKKKKFLKISVYKRQQRISSAKFVENTKRL